MLTVVMLLLSCNSREYSDIQGRWVCASWTAPSDPKEMCNGDVKFVFSEDRTYKSDFKGTVNSGDFEIIGDQLTCYPAGEMSIGVELVTLTTDTLEMLMNRSGTAEKLVLIRAPQD